MHMQMQMTYSGHWMMMQLAQMAHTAHMSGDKSLHRNAIHISYWGICPFCEHLIDNIHLLIHLMVAVWRLIGIQLFLRYVTVGRWKSEKGKMCTSTCLSQLSWNYQTIALRWLNIGPVRNGSTGRAVPSRTVHVTVARYMFTIHAFLFTKLIALLWYVPCHIANSTSCKINKQMQTQTLADIAEEERERHRSIHRNK